MPRPRVARGAGVGLATTAVPTTAVDDGRHASLTGRTGCNEPHACLTGHANTTAAAGPAAAPSQGLGCAHRAPAKPADAKYSAYTPVPRAGKQACTAQVGTGER
jgi:hypothetical protein